MDDGWEWASPDSLEGLLQRGRGEGHRRALEERDGAAEAVTRCVVHDPRWDRQVEDRSLYYARLFEELALDVAPLEAHLFAPDDYETRDERRTGLALETLGDLAGYGRKEAVHLLRRYAAEGWSWRWALDVLNALEDPAALDGLDETMADRIGEIESPAHEAGVHDVRRLWEKPETTTAELLQAVAKDPKLAYVVERRLREDATSDARDLLLAAAREGAEGSRSASLRVLGSHGDDRLLEVADAALEAGESDRIRNSARVGVVRLGTPASVAWARERASLGDQRGRVAVEVLAEHGDERDVRVLLAAFERARAGNDVYLLCDLADGFGRLGDERGVSLLEATFEDAVYSYLRKRCALALATTSPAFPSGLAVESLWDCEPGTRRVGALVVTSDLAHVRSRLRTLAGDEVEEPDVREAARQRIE